MWMRHKLRKIQSLLKKIGLDGFLIGIGCMIFLAWCAPTIGERDSVYPFHAVATYGVSGIFFFYGMGLGWQKLRDGVRLWRLHLVVQFSIFVLFPLLVLGLYEIFATPMYATLWIGIFYVSALPSTVSSSVVMVSIARGNVPAAIFNTSLSSVLGVFVTPAWMGIFLQRTDIPIDPIRAIGLISLQVLLPMAIGAALHPYFGAAIERHRKTTRLFDQTVVLVIVYTSFCDSFASGAFALFRPRTLGELGVGIVLLFFIVYGIISIICKRLRFNREDSITAKFCGSKKSLTHGTAIASALFTDRSSVGVILLPIMLYHAIQLIIVSIIAQKHARAAASVPSIAVTGATIGRGDSPTAR